MFGSCLIYLGMFGLSCFFLYVGEKNKSKLLTIIGLMLPCILAGVRATSVGTDVDTYVKPMYLAAIKSNNLFEYLEKMIPYGWVYRAIKEYEIGFTALVYFTTKIFGNVQIVLFVIQLMIIIPLYKGLKLFSQNNEGYMVWLGMLSYYLFFYNMSLNLMRQFVAISIIIYALACLSKYKYNKFALFVFLSFLFHKAALMVFLIGIVHYYLSRKGKVCFCWGDIRIDNSTVKILMIVLMCSICMLSLGFIPILLEKLGLGIYRSYLGTNVFFSINQVVLRIPIIIGILLLKRRYVKNVNYLFCVSVIIIEFFVAQLSKSSTYAYRIAMYFAAYNVYSYPMIFTVWNKKAFAKFLMIGYLLIYWYYMFVIKGSNETIPFVFCF